MRTLSVALVLLSACLAACVGAEGLQKGDDIPVFSPQHIAGPMKGSNACPT